MTASRAKIHIANYEVLSRIGVGELTEVYEGRIAAGPRAGTRVALKRLLAPTLAVEGCEAAFLEGAAHAQAAEHPHLVRVYEAGVLRGVSFMSMELVGGCLLSQLFDQCRERQLQLPVDFALYLAKSVLDALASIHELPEPEGAAHGNVTSRSIFITPSGEPKLGDHGWAPVRAAAAKAGLVRALPASHLTVAGDLWNAAEVLREMLTLEQPRRGDKGPARPTRELRPDLPRAVAAVADRALSPATRDRFPTARELAQELEQLFNPDVGTPLGVVALMRTVGSAHGPAPSRPPRQPPAREPLAPAPDEEPTTVTEMLPPPPVSAARTERGRQSGGARGTRSLPPVPAGAEPSASEVTRRDSPHAVAARAGHPPPPRSTPAPSVPRTTRPVPAASDQAAPSRPASGPRRESGPRKALAPADALTAEPVSITGAVRDIFGAEGRFHRGEKLLRKRQHRAALEAFRAAIALNATEGIFHAFGGWALFKTDPKNPEVVAAALQSIEKALALNPKLEQGHLFAGHILKDTGKRAEAQKSFEEAIRINPDSKDALNQLRSLARHRR